MCQALNIDIKHREDAIYREKCTRSKTLRTVQVLGVDILSNTLGREGPKESRSVLLGSSMMEMSESTSVHMLVQRTTRWHGPAFEEGFHHSNSYAPTLSPDCIPSSHQNRNSDIGKPAPGNKTFSLIWEAFPGVSHELNGSAAHVPGILRSIFPAVIIRTAKLTSSARRIFSTRIDGKFLKLILASPPDERNIDFLQRHKS